MIVTLALTEIVPETVDPDAGDVMLTTRLPNWARAKDGVIQNQQKITDRAAARSSLIFSPPIGTVGRMMKLRQGAPPDLSVGYSPTSCQSRRWSARIMP